MYVYKTTVTRILGAGEHTAWTAYFLYAPTQRNLLNAAKADPHLKINTPLREATICAIRNLGNYLPPNKYSWSSLDKSTTPNHWMISTTSTILSIERIEIRENRQV